jgi:type II secretion system protein I
MMQAMLDGFVKSPDAALRFILRHCGVRNSTPHSSGFARLACGLFTKPSQFHNFYGFLRGRHARIRSMRGGFTLLEVMIAMAILAITLVAVFQSQSQSISMAGDSRFLTTASLLAQSRMVEIDAADPREVTAGNGDFGEDFPDYRWQVEIGDTEIEVLKKISLTVTNSRMVVRNNYRLILYKVVLR